MTQAPSDNNIAPGTILAGKYRVARVLGRGGMGVVVEAHHIQLDDRVALKFLLPEYATHPEASERFLREARAAVKIKSEHVARVSDVGTLETGAPYMVMEYLNGTDLSSLLEKNGPMPLQDAVDYVIQGCEAINEAHTYGIVHRDIKPANLFLTKRPDGSPMVKVLDFGISKTVGAGVDGLTKTTATMGSALYMSPEQMRQSRSVDSRTDIYSMGITLYELLAGKQPFYANTLPELCAEVLTGTPTPLREVRSDLPPDFAAVLERAYARSLEQRYQSITEFVFALAAYAPARSQETLDRFARLANVQAPQAGRVDPRASAPQLGAYHQPLGPVPAQGQPGQPFQQQIQAGPYNANIPHSQRSTAAFAAGPPIGSQTAGPATFSTTGASKPSGGGGAAIGIAAGVLFLLAIGGGGGYFYFTKQKAAAAANNAASSQVEPATSSEAPKGADPEPAKSAEPAASPPPTESATAAPSASASAASASSPSSTKPDKPTTTTKPKPGETTKPTAPVETAKPVEAAKPPPPTTTSKPTDSDNGFGHR